MITLPSSSPVERASAAFVAEPSSDDLLIVCSHRLSGFVLPNRFWWSSITEDLPVNRLFIRDNFGLWYHAGLEGLSTGIEDTHAYLARFVDEHGFDRVFTIGLSSGGYAALLFGELLGAASIHSVAPRTRLSPDSEAHPEFDRFGVDKSLAQLWARPAREERYFDLRRYFEANPVKASVCRIYYDPHHDLDRFHAENLAGLPGIELETISGAGHVVGRELLGRPGFLQSVIEGH